VDADVQATRSLINDLGSSSDILQSGSGVAQLIQVDPSQLTEGAGHLGDCERLAAAGQHVAHSARSVARAPCSSRKSNSPSIGHLRRIDSVESVRSCGGASKIGHWFAHREACPRSLKRKEPIHDAAHVRNAIVRFKQVQGVTDAERDAAWKRIKSAAKKHKVELNEQDWRDLS
jgi:hypothetical protein